MIDIVKSQLNELVGDVPDLHVKLDNDRIYIIINAMPIVDFFTKGEEHFIIKHTYPKLDLVFSKEVFKEYFPQVIQAIIIPAIKVLYKKNYIHNIPDSLIDKTPVNLSNITTEWFKNTFETICDEYGNSETIDNIEIVSKDNGIEITFDLDCDRYGYFKSNSINVSNRGNIRINFAEIIEGSDIDYQIRKALEKHLV